MIIGHNPGLHDLARGLVGGGEERALSELHAKFPTGALATLLVPHGGWRDLDRGRAELASFVVPRALPPA
jgi:phosphohistidine phosphatase